MRHLRTTGFTLLEIIIVVGILGVIAAISLVSVRDIYLQTALRESESEVYGALAWARSNTIASTNDTVYGVRLTASSVTRFIGPTYSAGAATNIVFTFGGGVTATSSLISTGTSVVFKRLTGESTASGTVYFRNGAGTTTLMIYSSGLVEYE